MSKIKDELEREREEKEKELGDEGLEEYRKREEEREHKDLVDYENKLFDL